MNKMLKNNRGVILVATYVVIMVIAILSTAFFTRVIAESRNAQINKAKVEAFYAAQAGLNFAYTESYLSGWTWKTHDWDWEHPDTLIPTVDLVVDHTDYPSRLGLGATWDNHGYYTIPGYNFKVRAYQEVDWDKLAQGYANPYTGMTIIHAQGQDPQGQITRTLELSVSQQSMYRYFYFFPETHTFNSGSYDGSGYGAIHVNGNIIFINSPVFTNLIELSAGDNYQGGSPTHTGYLQYYSAQYSAPYQWDDNDPGTTLDRDGWAPMPKSSAPPYNYDNTGDWFSTDYHFNYHARAYARFNQDAQGNPFPIPRTLNSGDDYIWEYDKYSGTAPNNEQPVKFRVDNDVLAWLSRQEYNATATARTSNPTYYLLTADEQSQFNLSPATFDWDTWKTTHSDYEEKFWRARYDCQDTGVWANDIETAKASSFSNTYNDATGTHHSYSINHEWWDDLTYGNDRPSGDNKPAQAEGFDSPEKGGYYLNTEKQKLAWQEYLEGKQVIINKADKATTDPEKQQTLDLDSVIKEAHTGGEYLVPLKLEVNYKEKAQNSGIYIGTTITQAFLQWQQTFYEMFNKYYAGLISFGELISWYNQNPPPPMYEPQNPIAQVSTTDYFFNTARPVSIYEYSNYSSLWDRFYKFTQTPQKTKVLTIDVAALKAMIEDGTFNQLTGHDFNGIIYVESQDYNDINYDYSVRLINAGVLPEAGLTLVTPHNIYVQGNFNLEGQPSAGEQDQTQARDYQAIENYLDYHPQEGYTQADFQWHPAALISTQRLIYTLSEDFNQPQTLPVSYNYWNQTTKDYYPYSLDDQHFLDNLCPQPNATNLPTTVKNFFTNHPEITPPTSWSWSWINTNMDPNKYLDAADAQKALLDAGNNQYRTNNESLMPNRVLRNITYNTAMVSPYDPQGYLLERWYDTGGNLKTRKITGAFIQLEAAIQYDLTTGNQIGGRAWVPLAYYVRDYNPQSDSYKYYYSITQGYQYPNGKTGNPGYRGSYYYAYYWHGEQPNNNSTYWPSYNYAYEINFASSAQTDQQSTADFLAGAVIFWRQVPSTEF